MSFTYGFYNSQNGDRKYNAEQMAAVFDALINDGVQANIGDAMVVKTTTTTRRVAVGPGRAWFNSTWSYNDADYPLTLNAVTASGYSRYDAICLVVDKSTSVRANSLQVVQGTASTSPVKPTPTNTSTKFYHILAYVKVTYGMTTVPEENIENRVGTTDAPFITGILQTIDISTLLAQWQGDFEAWWDGIKEIINDETITQLANRTLPTEATLNKYGFTNQNKSGYVQTSTDVDSILNQISILIRSGDIGEIRTYSKPLSSIPEGMYLCDGRPSPIKSDLLTDKYLCHQDYPDWIKEQYFTKDGYFISCVYYNSAALRIHFLSSPETDGSVYSSILVTFSINSLSDFLENGNIYYYSKCTFTGNSTSTSCPTNILFADTNGLVCNYSNETTNWPSGDYWKVTSNFSTATKYTYSGSYRVLASRWIKYGSAWCAIGYSNSGAAFYGIKFTSTGTTFTETTINIDSVYTVTVLGACLISSYFYVMTKNTLSSSSSSLHTFMLYRLDTNFNMNSNVTMLTETSSRYPGSGAMFTNISSFIAMVYDNSAKTGVVCESSLTLVSVVNSGDSIYTHGLPEWSLDCGNKNPFGENHNDSMSYSSRYGSFYTYSYNSSSKTISVTTHTYGTDNSYDANISPYYIKYGVVRNILNSSDDCPNFLNTLPMFLQTNEIVQFRPYGLIRYPRGDYRSLPIIPYNKGYSYIRLT